MTELAEKAVLDHGLLRYSAYGDKPTEVGGVDRLIVHDESVEHLDANDGLIAVTLSMAAPLEIEDRAGLTVAVLGDPK